MADRRAISRFDGDETAAAGFCLRPLWRLQRKEPGWVVGEHMQVFRCPEAEIEVRTTGSRLETTERDRPGEVGRSREKRIECVCGGDPVRFTRVGEAERGKKVFDRAEKLEEEFAKPLAEEDAPGVEQNRPDGEIGLWNRFVTLNTGAFDLAREDAAIFFKKHGTEGEEL
ncbi:hypothetical protein M5K25_014090 [Dendrobium thyrsiflorum]|uniref:Uncharacterized protein n=1 Tax=Dendrobium thyrsiflorum TaxID=117978 RepID=A0ABD0V1W8_DENTH